MSRIIWQFTCYKEPNHMTTLQGGLDSVRQELSRIHHEIAHLEQRLERLRSVTAKAMADLSGTERDDRMPTFHNEELERVASKIVTKLAQEVKASQINGYLTVEGEYVMKMRSTQGGDR